MKRLLLLLFSLFTTATLAIGPNEAREQLGTPCHSPEELLQQMKVSPRKQDREYAEQANANTLLKLTKTMFPGGMELVTEESHPEFFSRMKKISEVVGLDELPVILLHKDCKVTPAAAIKIPFSKPHISILKNIPGLDGVTAHEFAHIKYNHPPKRLALLAGALVASTSALGVGLHFLIKRTKKKYLSKEKILTEKKDKAKTDRYTRRSSTQKSVRYYKKALKKLRKSRSKSLRILYGLGIPVTIIGSVFTAIISMLWLARRHEWQADQEAIDAGYGKELHEGLAHFHAVINPKNLPEKTSIFDSHPSLADRIAHIEKCLAQQEMAAA